MRKLVAVCGAILVSACGGAQEDGAEQAMQQPEEAASTSVVGTYSGTTEEGVDWSSVIAADGSYEDRMGDEVTETGTWTEQGNRACFKPDVAAGAAAEPEACFTIGAVAADGTVVLTNPDGEQIAVRKTSS